MTTNRTRQRARSTDQPLKMDLQAFVYSASEGVDLQSLRSTFVDVDSSRLLDALLELGNEGVVAITVRHQAHDRDKVKTSRSLGSTTESFDRLNLNA